MSEASPQAWPASLTDALIAELKASGISASVATRMGVHGVDDARAAYKLVGSAIKDWEAGRLPALIFPYYLPTQRDPVAWRAKPRKPLEYLNAKTGKITVAKYTQKRDTGTHVYLGPSLLFGDAAQDVRVPLLGTEGEKKVLAGESAGFSCLGLSGVHQWHVKGKKVLHPTFGWIELCDREFFLCFDADALTNGEVRKQELEFGYALAAKGAKVYIVRFPNDAPKLDDFLATHPREDLLALLQDARERGALPADTRAKERNSEEWKDLLDKLRIDAESGAPVRDLDNIVAILQSHPAWEGVLAFDARRERQLFLREPPFSVDVALKKSRVPRALIDSDITRIACWLVAQPALGWALTPKPGVIEAAVTSVCERNRFDAVQDYLRALPAWDGVARLDLMGATFFGTETTPYAQTVFAKWMLSAISRARQPGCQVDHVLVLEGPQGLGKSTALRILAGDDHFSDSLPPLGRDAHEHCLGPWIVELGELDHMRRSEATALKAFLSTRAPAFRSAYGRRTVEHPRRCVFAATTNDVGYLIDSTGNRRFWPVECKEIDLVALKRDRDQLWAEALTRVRANESWHIEDPDVQAAAVEQQAARRQIDPWHPIVSRFVRGRAAVTVGDVLDHLGTAPEQAPQGFGSYQRTTHPTSNGGRVWQYDARSAQRVAAILRELGWVRRCLRVNGDRVWQYVQDKPDIAGSTQTKTGSRVDRIYPRESTEHDPPDPVDPPFVANPGVGAREGEIRQPSEQGSLSFKTTFSGSNGSTGSKVEESEGYADPPPDPPPAFTGSAQSELQPKPKGRRF